MSAAALTYVLFRIFVSAIRYADHFLGERFDVPVIDLWRMSREWLENAGDKASEQLYMNVKPGDYRFFPVGQTDNSHLKYSGAMLYAGMIADGLKKLDEPYALLVENDPHIASAAVTEING